MIKISPFFSCQCKKVLNSVNFLLCLWCIEAQVNFEENPHLKIIKSSVSSLFRLRRRRFKGYLCELSMQLNKGHLNFVDCPCKSHKWVNLIIFHQCLVKLWTWRRKSSSFPRSAWRWIEPQHTTLHSG